MNASAELFESHRPRLFGIACRMLGSRCEAEDLLQDAYLRWHESDRLNVQSAIAFLVTITTRLCLDRLRKRRQEYVQDLADAWSLEALAGHSAPSPELQRECCEEVSAALAAVFDRLGREERAAFLLHDVFDYGYPDLARTLGKAEPACRQLVHRARKRVREPGPRVAAISGPQKQLRERLLDAVMCGDRHVVMSLVAADARICDN